MRDKTGVENRDDPLADNPSDQQQSCPVSPDVSIQSVSQLQHHRLIWFVCCEVADLVQESLVTKIRSYTCKATIAAD